jgi:uncharacterized protein
MFLHGRVGSARGDRRSPPRSDLAKGAELGIPVLIHTGEPSRRSGIRGTRRTSDGSSSSSSRTAAATTPKFASFEQTMAEQHNLFRRHPKTIFINAHLGWLGNDLARLGRLLDELPNMMTEIGAVLAELGRQPRAAREFLIRYQDRVLIGKDSWAPTSIHVYFRTSRPRTSTSTTTARVTPLEDLRTRPSRRSPPKKIYFKNALRMIPGLDASAFPE